MRVFLLLLVHLVVSVVKLLGPGGARGLLAESLLLKQQMLIATRGRNRAPNLSFLDRFLLGIYSLLIKPARIVKNAAILRPSTLFGLHRALNNCKYRHLFGGRMRGKPGPNPRQRQVECRACASRDELGTVLGDRLDRVAAARHILRIAYDADIGRRIC